MYEKRAEGQRYNAHVVDKSCYNAIYLVTFVRFPLLSTNFVLHFISLIQYFPVIDDFYSNDSCLAL